MILRTWIQLFVLMLFVTTPLFLVQFIQQRQALFMVSRVTLVVPPDGLLEQLRADLHKLATLMPQDAERLRTEFVGLAEMEKGTQDLVAAANTAIIELSWQLIFNATLALAGGLALALVVARSIVKRVAALQKASARSAQHEESLHALRNWQTVARALVHELRAPVSPIKLVAGSIVSKKATMEPDAYAKAAEQGGEMILVQVAIIEKMIDSFTQFARLPDAEPRNDCLNEFVEEMFHQYKNYSPEALILTHSLPPSRLHAALDRALLQRVVFNLIRNAVNANLPRKISLALTLTEESGEARLILSNNGTAVPAEVVTHLFDPKVSLSRKQTGQGLGLGLVICRKIVLDHGGDIELTENREGAVSFSISLPLCKGGCHGRT